ncbi:MAG TPA: GMC family oxidoreductase N-terminal domain-containing protein [Xanthobacteraceae bacterium]|nr:GMC family oxidoreductase N-terminal domain-containing protein [Xanthobacteraceae bacterium]
MALGPQVPLAAEYDYVVVGGGSGGAVVARRLAERSDASVLLIEAGPSDVGVSAIDDAANWTALLRGEYDWGYDYAPTPHVNGRTIGIPRGRVLGGSSSINAMIWYRGHPSDYDGWAAAGATGWNFSAVLPYFKRAEDWEGGANTWRGAGGPLRIERPRDPHPLARAMLDAAAALGLPLIDDMNGASNEGATRPNLNACNGVRWSVARGYLRPVVERANLTVLTESLAIKLGFDGGRCVSVTHLVAGAPRVTRAAREIILCAGAIDSPRLLMISGIGPAAELMRLGVPVVIDLPGVGQNLQDHPLLMGVNFAPRAPLAPARDNGGGAIVNWKSRPDLPGPDLHAFVVQGPHAGPQIMREYSLPRDCFAISPGLMRSKSRGYMRLESAAPGGHIEIQPNFLCEPSDVQALAEGIEFCMELAAAPAFAGLLERPVAPDRRLSKREREAFVRQACDTFFHTCGTCAMGGDGDSVVDPSLRVRGVEALRIADASVIPVIPSCNTNAPVVMIAERAADFILGTVPVATMQAELIDARA